MNERFDKFLKVYESDKASDQASFRSLETQIGQLSSRVDTTEKMKFRANTEVNPKDECKVVITRSKRKPEVEIIEIESSEDEEKGKGKLKTPLELFHEVFNQAPSFPGTPPQCIKQKSCKEKEKGKLKTPLELFHEVFKEVLESSETSPRRFEYERGSTYYSDDTSDSEEEEEQEQPIKPRKQSHPQKMKDSGTITLPCVVNDVDMGEAMIDSGSSVNLMPFSEFKKIKGLRLKPTNTTLIVADGSSRKPLGMVEDAIVRIKELEFLIDFLVVDMANKRRVSLILGRPFMRTSKMVIRVHDVRIMLKDQYQVLNYNGPGKSTTRRRKRTNYKRFKGEASEDGNNTDNSSSNSCNVL